MLHDPAFYHGGPDPFYSPTDDHYLTNDPTTLSLYQDETGPTVQRFLAPPRQSRTN